MNTFCITIAVLLLVLHVYAIRDYPVNVQPLLAPAKNTTNIFNLGIVGSFAAVGNSAPGLVRFMVEQLNRDQTLLPDVLFQLYQGDLPSNSKAQALLAAETLIDSYNVRGFIGSLNSDETELTQLIASLYTIPHVAGTPTSPALSDKVSYPYLLRINPPAQYMNDALLDLMQHYGWEQALVIYSNDDYGTAGFNNLQTKVLQTNISFQSVEIATGTKDFSSLVPFVEAAIATYRMRIFVLYTQPGDSNYIMQTLYNASLVGNTTVNTYIMMYAATLSFTTNQGVYNVAKMPWFLGAVGLCSRGPVPGPLFDTLNAGWLAANTTLFPGARPNLGPSWYYADVVYTFAHALDAIMKKGTPFQNISGPQLLAAMVASNFTGVTGKVIFDSHYDHPSDFVWYNFQPGAKFNATSISAAYSPITNSTSFHENNLTLIFNNMLSPPDGICRCLHGSCDNFDVCTCISGWSGSDCTIYKDATGNSKFGTGDIIAVVVAPAVAIFLVGLAAVMFVRYKRRRMIKDLSDQQRSLIKREDIAMHDRLGRGAAGEVFRGTFRGTEVAVKKLLASATSQAAVEQFEIETAIMTSLRHPNIVLFMGVCLVRESNEMLLVMELMDKGSLHDIIHNPKIKLPFSLCLHISYQAAKGMNFLHQSDPPIIHCDLKSHNILMDDKWNAKISDFGITRLKTINQKKDKDQQPSGSSMGTIYWTAPEVLAGKGHSEASDVYSFGIVLWEIFHRETPYKGKEPMLVVMEVQANMRPILKPDLEPAIRDLIVECWNENPAVRPKFDDVMNRLRELNAKSPVSAYGLHESTHGDAPTGLVYLVATEVLGANEMWDRAPMAMYQAMVQHNKLIRSTVDSHNGFESDFAKNGFFLAFRSLKDVMNWCMATQTLLVNSQWPTKLSTLVRGENELNFRVKMAVHVGVPNCQTDHSGNTLYTGPTAERTKKILSSSSSSTFILISRAIMEQINAKGVQFTDGYTSNVFGETIESARSTDSAKVEEIYEIVPNSLAKYQARAYMHTPTEVPNGIMDVDELELIPSVSKRPLTWDIAYSDLRELESAGKGSIGDYVRSMWKDKEVVQKVLLNQQIGEEDQLLLKARASVLAKLNHKNLLDFYGVCLEPGKISLVVGYLPKASLNTLLFDNTFSLTYNSKVKLVKQIADGMEYMANMYEHPWLAMHGNLKSCNVLVQRETMTVKLCDFGQGNLKDLARTMTSVGTVAWTAPEILNGEDLTPKITVYSFGIIMWEIYARAFPYQNEHPIKAVTKIVAGYRPIVPADCPAPYKELMSRCWSTDPEQRPGWGEIVSTLSTM